MCDKNLKPQIKKESWKKWKSSLFKEMIKILSTQIFAFDQLMLFYVTTKSSFISSVATIRIQVYFDNGMMSM